MMAQVFDMLCAVPSPDTANDYPLGECPPIRMIDVMTEADTRLLARHLLVVAWEGFVSAVTP